MPIKNLALLLKLLYQPILIGLIYLSLFSCQERVRSDEIQEQTVINKTEITTVPVSTLRSNVFYKEIISQGKVKARFRSDVTFDLSERIESVAVKVGQRVKKGQVLTHLEDFEYRYQLEKIEQQIKQAELQIEEKLITLGYEPEQRDSIPSELLERLAIEHNLVTLKVEKKRAVYILEKTKIKAPISGVIANLEAQAGNPSDNYKKLCTIINDQTLQVDFPILEAEINLVRLGMPIRIQPLYERSKEYKGTIATINPEINKHGMTTATANISSTNHKLVEGMQVRIYLQELLPQQLVVPKSAIVDRQGKQVAFVYKNGVANWNYVEIGYENSTSYTIDKGLHVGDTLIIDNNLNLAHLEKVKVAVTDGEE